MIDYKLALISGTDIPVPECQIVIHQPKIKEIALIGEKDFFTGAQCLCVNKSLLGQDETVLANINNFQIFMTIMSEEETRDKSMAVKSLFTILFPQYQIIFTPQSILMKMENETIIIDENNFEALQEVLKDVFCLSSGMNQDVFNPQTKKAKEIAEKLMRGRERIAAEKGKENGSALVQYVSVLTVGIGSMSLQDALNLTLYQLFDLIQRYTLYVGWDLDVRTRLAGGKPDSQPDNWMKNIH